MHGLINRSLQCFISEIYSEAEWEKIAADAGVGFTNFEALMVYDDHLTTDVIDAACARLEKPQEDFLEDLGTFLCTDKKLDVVRRLLRFGGDSFTDFLFSLDDLADRVRLALPELEIPKIEITVNTAENITMRCRSEFSGFGHVLVGIIQSMADDYGTLALFQHVGREGDAELVSIHLLSASHTEGRDFVLALRAS